MNLIFSLLIEIDYFTLSTYKKYKSDIIGVHKNYAKLCNADYIFVESDYEWEIFYNKYKTSYPFITDYHIVNLFKIYLIEKFTNEYDNVIYLDFDILVGNDKLNVFSELDFEKLQIFVNTFDLTNWEHTVGCSSRKIRAFLTSYLLNFENISAAIYTNTGIIGANKTSIEKLNFFENIDYCIRKLNESNYLFKVIDNEIIFGYQLYENNVIYNNIQGNWHHKAKNDDLSSSFIHCQTKDYIPLILKKLQN